MYAVLVVLALKNKRTMNCKQNEHPHEGANNDGPWEHERGEQNSPAPASPSNFTQIPPGQNAVPLFPQSLPLIAHGTHNYADQMIAAMVA